MTEDPKFSIHMMGIDIPLDPAMQKKINNAIYMEVQRVIQKEDFHKVVGNLLLHNPEYAKKIFEPIIREIIHELDFKATLDVD